MPVEGCIQGSAQSAEKESIMLRKLMLFALLALATFSAVFAKVDPYVEDPDEEWGDLADPASIWSWQAFAAQVGRLATDNDVDAFTVNFPEPVEDWEFQMMVPVCGDHFAAFFPSVAVIGPGLETTADTILPFDLPEGMGALVFSEDTYKERYAEKGQRSIMTSNIVTGEPVYFNTARTVDIPQAGDYIIAIYEPDGNVGAYMFSIAGGEHDLFGERPLQELEAAFDTLFSGEWMGQDCNKPLDAET
jgi:hypothetical protein